MGWVSSVDPRVTLVGLFIVLVALRVPIAFALGLASLATAWQLGLPPLIVAQRMAAGVNSFPLLAIPFFILAGNLMVEGGVARRLVAFARLLVGRIPGGQGMVNVVDSMLFGGISGSAVADVAATGSIDIPMMVQAGYDRGLAVALTVASSTQGIIIPPSHNAVIYSMAAGGVSIGALFLAGYVPGILLGVALMATVYVLALRRNYPRFSRPPWREAVRIVADGVLGLMTGVIIIGGIVFGIVTATEAAVLGALYAALLGVAVYRELDLVRLWRAIRQSVRTTALVAFIIATSSAFAWLMAYLRIPAALSEWLLGLTDSRVAVLLLINVILLALGCIMDMAPLIVIVTPILLPVARAYGVDPVHFGIILLLSLGIGLSTPPVGTALFVGCGVGRVSIEEASRNLLYFWPAMLAMLLVVTFVPDLVLWLPRMFGLVG